MSVNHGFLVCASGSGRPALRGPSYVTHTTAPNFPCQNSNIRLYGDKIHLHDRAAEETDANHEQPAGDSANGVDGVAERDVQVELGEPAVSRVQSTLVGRGLLVSLLGMNLVQLLGSDSGGIHIDDVERGRQALLVSRLRLRNLEVVDGGRAAGPGGTEDPLIFTVK